MRRKESTKRMTFGWYFLDISSRNSSECDSFHFNFLLLNRIKKYPKFICGFTMLEPVYVFVLSYSWISSEIVYHQMSALKSASLNCDLTKEYPSFDLSRDIRRREGITFVLSLAYQSFSSTFFFLSFRYLWFANCFPEMLVKFEPADLGPIIDIATFLLQARCNFNQYG